MVKPQILLAIETSCDETAVAVLRSTKTQCRILSSLVSSQITTHQKYGGIVPEVAARMHSEVMIPLVKSALKAAAIRDPRRQLDGVVATTGPGLITALLVGVETAKSLAYAWEKPFVAVNHIEGHVLSAQKFNAKTQTFRRGYPLPALCLIVSGGHTDLLFVKNIGEYERIGGTRDDAVGEAFDKVAKMMKLGYPGGPIVAQLAEGVTASRFRDMPRPMLHSGDFDMSFSGIKTAVLHRLSPYQRLTTAIKKEMCFSFQEAVTDVLVYKTIEAAKRLGVKSIIIGGGVSANQRLREKMLFEINMQLPKVPLFVPERQFTGDNAVMIALAAQHHFENKNYTGVFGFRPDPQWEL